MLKKLVGEAMPLGCVMVDITGTQLQPHEKERLMHPLVAGVILFSRNFESAQQIQQLCEQIHALRHPKLLIAVDHEGGRVQRFKQGFTRLPPMGLLGQTYHQNEAKALKLAENIGWIMATELLSVGVDFSFAPVVDLGYGDSRVIGDRAFDADPLVVAKLATAIMEGMHSAGMASVAKHFPGHGYIEEDTHLEIAVDNRSLEQIKLKDIQPFLHLIEKGIEAIMPAHVCYPKVDDLPAGFSSIWLQQVLRQQCHFEGAIISDDLSMQAATVYGNITERVTLALQAGCDLTLVCNHPEFADQVLSELKVKTDNVSHARLIRLHGNFKMPYVKLPYSPLWQAATEHLNEWMATEYNSQQDLV